MTSGNGTVRYEAVVLGGARDGAGSGQKGELAVDLHLTPQEVDAVKGDPEALPLPQPGAGGEGHQRPIPLRHGDGRREDHLD